MINLTINNNLLNLFQNNKTKKLARLAESGKDWKRYLGEKDQTSQLTIGAYFLIGFVALSLSNHNQTFVESDSDSNQVAPVVEVMPLEEMVNLNTQVLPELNYPQFKYEAPAILTKKPECTTSGCQDAKLVTALTHPKLGRFYEKDLQCMARNIYFESRGESMEGKYATAEVVLSRMQDDRFPKQVCSVVNEKLVVNKNDRVKTIWQFSWLGEDPKEVDYESQAWADSLKAAIDFLSGKQTNYTKGALFYHAEYVKNPWKGNPRVKFVAKVGKHYYYDFIAKGITLTTPMSKVKKIVAQEKALKQAAIKVVKKTG